MCIVKTILETELQHGIQLQKGERSLAFAFLFKSSDLEGKIMLLNVTTLLKLSHVREIVKTQS